MPKVDDLKQLESSHHALAQRVATLEGAGSAKPEKPTWLYSAAMSALIIYLGWIGITVNNLSNKIATMDGLLAPQHLAAAATNPNRPANIEQAEKIIKTAVATKQPIDPSIVKEAGIRFIDASTVNEAAWNVSLQLIDYRSSLNSTYVPVIGGIVPSTRSSSPTFRIFPIGNNHSKGELILSVECHDSVNGGGDEAQFGSLGQPPDQLATGCKWLTMQGTPNEALVLDGVHMKNVIIRDAVFQYSGGPVLLDHVYFINCRFLMSSRPTTRSFGKSLLEAEATSFNSKTDSNG